MPDFLSEATTIQAEITLGTRSTSINAVLRGGAAPADVADRPVVLLRADMDALPIPEATGMEFSNARHVGHSGARPVRLQRPVR